MPFQPLHDSDAVCAKIIRADGDETIKYIIFLKQLEAPGLGIATLSDLHGHTLQARLDLVPFPGREIPPDIEIEALRLVLTCAFEHFGLRNVYMALPKVGRGEALKRLESIGFVLASVLRGETYMDCVSPAILRTGTCES